MYVRSDRSREARKHRLTGSGRNAGRPTPTPWALIKEGQQQVLLVVILFLVLATLTRFALCYVEWRDYTTAAGIPATFLAPNRRVP